MRRLLLRCWHSRSPARRRGDDAAGPARHRRAGRPESLPDRAGEGTAGRRVCRGRRGRRERAQGRPAGGWTADDLARTIAENRAAASHGLSTWVNLSASRSGGRAGGASRSCATWSARSRPIPGERDRAVEGRRRAVALPMRPASLRFAYCLATGRKRLVRRPRAGGHRPALGHRPGAARRRLVAGALLRGHGRPRRQQLPDRDRRPGSRSERAGSWTNILGLATPKRAVWTTLDLLDVAEHDAAGNVQLPTREQCAWSTTRS